MELIKTGMVKEQTDQGPVSRPYEMRYLSLDQLDQVMELQQLVYDSVDDKQKFVADPREFFEETALAPGRGMMIGIFVGDRMIAARSISFPGLSKENLGYDLHLDEAALKKVCHLEASMVLPEFRGNRLQAEMMKPTIDYILQEGFCIVLSTISPYNYPSLKNIMDAGLVIRDLRFRGENYGGRLRFLLALDFCATVPEFLKPQTAQNTDITRQKELLSMGYAGFALKRQPDQSVFSIHYGVPDPPLSGFPDIELLSSK